MIPLRQIVENPFPALAATKIEFQIKTGHLVIDDVTFATLYLIRVASAPILMSPVVHINI